MTKITYNLEKDINSGAIEVYSSNSINWKYETFDDLERTSRLHSMNTLEAANSMMQMYSMNYSRRSELARNRVNKWNEYYDTMKSKKKYKCKECGWKGKITEMSDGIDHEHCCPECNEDFDLSAV